MEVYIEKQTNLRKNDGIFTNKYYEFRRYLSATKWAGLKQSHAKNVT